MQQKKSPKFLEKLYDLLESEQYKYLRWSDDGHKFEVCDIKKLERQILRVQYKQKSFASFISQICMDSRDQKLEEISTCSVIVILLEGTGIQILSNRKQLINIISQNKLKVLEELSNQENNLKRQIYEAEHQQLTETLKDLQNQQKQIQIRFNEQIHLQMQLKLRILQIMNQINNHDLSINIKAQHSYQLLCKVMQIIPHDADHVEEMEVIKHICKVFNEFHKESISSYIGSPIERLTPVPFYLQDSMSDLSKFSCHKSGDGKFNEYLQSQATQIFQPSQVKQQFKL